MTSNSSDAHRPLRRADLHHALAGAQRQAGRARAAGRRAGPGRRPSPPASSGTSSAADMPPRSDTVPACSGSTGSGSTSVLNARPRWSPAAPGRGRWRARRARTASCLARPLRRRPSAASSDSAAVRATSPVAERITWHGSSATSSGPAGADAASTSLRSPSIRVVRRGGGELLDDRGQLVGDDLLEHPLVVQDLGDSSAISSRSRSCSASSSMPVELGQPPQRGVEDVGGLDLGEPELAHQAVLGGLGVLAGPDQPDHLVDVEQRDQQAVDQVQPLLALARGGTRCAGSPPRSGGRGTPPAAP